MWVVKRVFRVRRAEELVLLSPGDEIPEAAFWDNKAFWIARGYIQEIARPTPKNPVTIQVAHLYKTRKVPLTLVAADDTAVADAEPETLFDAVMHGKKGRRK